MLFNPNALSEIRRIQGLTRSELADKAHKSRPYITQLESGDRKSPSSEAIGDIGGALGVEDDRAFYIEPTVDELLKELALARAREQVAS